MSEAIEPGIRLAMVENDPAAAIGLCAIIRRRLPSSRIVWVEHDGGRAIERALGPWSADAVDLLLVDMNLDGTPGTSVCREIRTHAATPALLAVTAFPLRHYAERAASAGAQGIAGKTDFAQLCDAIMQVAAGGVLDADLYGISTRFETAEAAHHRLRDEDPSGMATLSERERQVLELYARAMKPHEIASRLGVALSTVKTTLDRAQGKLAAPSRAELVRAWWEANR